MHALIAAQAAAILVLGLLVAGLLRSHAEILRRLHDLGAGLEDVGAGSRADPVSHRAPIRLTDRPALDVTGATLEGGSLSVGVTGTGRRTLLAFLSTGCGSCLPFWESFSDPHLELPGGDTRLVIVAKDPEAESESRLGQLAPAEVPLVLSGRTWDDYGVPVSPYFVLVDGSSGSVIGEGSAPTWDRVVSLLEQALADADLAARRRGRRPRREARADRELLAAGVHPGHPSLYPEGVPEEHRHG